MQLSETKRHYKMYKSGKSWIITGITATALLMGTQIEVLAANGDSQDQIIASENVTAILPIGTAVTESATDSSVANIKNDSANKSEDDEPQLESNATENSTALTVAEDPESGSDAPLNAGSAAQSVAETKDSTAAIVEKPADEQSSGDQATNEGELQASSTSASETELTAVSASSEADTESEAQVATNLAPATVAARSYPQADVDINTWMPDKNFQLVTLWVINDELGLGLTDVNQITQAMMGQLKKYFITTKHQEEDREFYFAVMNTVSLKGFEYATNVERLWFTPNLEANEKWQDKFVIYGKLKDISALKGLNNLTELNLQLNDIDDITALAGLHLTIFSLSYNHISDFTPLESSLTTLAKSGTMANQKIVLKDTVTLNIDPNTGKLVTSSFAFGKDKTHNLAITPVDGSDAAGSNLTETTIEWTNFKQSGYLKYQWHDEWLAAHGFDCNGFVWIPFCIQNDDSGTIQIEFVDEQGNHLSSDIYLNHGLDTTYDVGTDAKVIERLQALKGKQLGIKEIKGSPNWTASKELGHLTYVLAPIRPTVDFQVVDENGQPIPNVTLPNQQGDFDEEWQATLPTIPGYEFVRATENGQGLTVTDNQLSGKFVGDQTIQLTYRVKSQNATIHFEYEDGTSVGDDVQLTGKHGDPIKFPTRPEIPGYFADDLPTAYFQDGDNDYTVVYRKAGKVTVQYVDETGNQVSPTEDLSGKVGTDYQTQPKEIAGYHLVKQPQNQHGQFSKQPTTVVYQYVKTAVVAEDGRPITVQYVDETGQPVASADQLTGKIGDKYLVTAKVISGYDFVEVSGNQAGTFSDQAKTIKFVYRQVAVKQGTVTVHYVDTHGREIAKETVLTGEVGHGYQIEALLIDGYRLKRTVGQASGQFNEDAVDLHFIYEPIDLGTDSGQGPDVGQQGTSKPVLTMPGLDQPATDKTDDENEAQAKVTGDHAGQSVKPVTHPTVAPVSTAETTKLASLSHKSDATELPQTGEQRLSWPAVLGTCLLGLVAYVAGRKRV